MRTFEPIRRTALFFAVLTLFFLLSPLAIGEAFAAQAVINCKLCAEPACDCGTPPCYCSAEPCGPCAGEEGDWFYFNGGNSTGTSGVGAYWWDVNNDSQTDSQAVFYATQFKIPNNPSTYPSGWPVSLQIRDNAGNYDTETIDVPIANVAPTPILYITDIAGDAQYEEAYVFSHVQALFHAEESHDRAKPAKVCVEGVDLSCGISTFAWDFDYDGSTFNPTVFNNPTPLHTWPGPGTYTVRLRVQDDDTPPATAFTTLTVHVINDGPFATIVPPEGDFTEGERVGFSGNDTGTPYPITSWEWDFDHNPPTFESDAQGRIVYTRFPDAEQYIVALKVTDNTAKTFTTYHVVNPKNIPPVANLVVKTTDGTLLNPPYTIGEGQKLRFDARGSYTGCIPGETCIPGGSYNPPTVEVAPGNVMGYRWDWKYNGLQFIPYPGTIDPFEDYAWNNDSGSGKFTVMLRVFDDDNQEGVFTSDDFISVQVTVTDIEPLAGIYVCDRFGNNCAAPTATPEVAEGDIIVLQAEDIGGNTDPIINYEWDFYYTGEPDDFTPDPTFTGQKQVEYSWVEMQPQHVAVRITDNNGTTAADHKSALGQLEITIIDKKPTALITPNNGTIALEVNEGQQITFSAENSSKSRGDEWGRFRWDLDYNGSTFEPDTDQDWVSNCEGGECTRFDAWETPVECIGGAAPNNDCPEGRGTLPISFQDGPGTQKIALCVEDKDVTNVCVSGVAPGDVQPHIYTLDITIKNVAPHFDLGCSTPVETIYDNETFTFRPCVVEPAGGLDPLSFNCDTMTKPSLMECNPATGELNWEPGANDVVCTPSGGCHEWEYTVCDDDGGCDTLGSCLTVLNANDPPTINGFLGDSSALVDQSYSADLYASDPDAACGEILYYYICNQGYYKPAMNINLNGVFTWTPTASDLGYKDIMLCVRDDEGSEDCSICYTHTLQVVPGEQVPEVSCGPDKTVDPGKICMTGEITSNPGELDLTYGWQQVNTPETPVAVCLDGFSSYPSPPKACFATSHSGPFTFGVKASNQTFTGPQDKCLITVNSIQPAAIVPGNRNYDLGVQIELDGSRSGDYNANDSLAYQWTDPEGLLDDTLSPTPTFQVLDLPNLGVGAYWFQLTVDEDGGALSSPPTWGYMEIEILDIDSENKVADALPTAIFQLLDENGDAFQAGQSAPETGKPFLLDASRSSARGSDVGLKYVWDCIDDEPGDLSMGTFADEPEVLRVTVTRAGAYTFTLVTEEDVPDGRRSVTTNRTIHVGTETNWPPSANAGENQSVQIGQKCPSPVTDYKVVTLDGSASSDREQATLSYSWRQVDGIIVPLIDAGTATPSFMAFAPGLYAFELVVNDGTHDSEPDVVYVSVAGKGQTAPNIAIANNPRYNALTQTLTVDPGKQAILDASPSFHPQAKAFDFVWTQTGGPAVVLSSWNNGVVSFWPDMNDVAYDFRLVLWDENGNPSLPLDIHVKVPVQDNLPPVCEVVSDEIENTTGNVIELDASPTYDPNSSQTLAFQWRQVPNPNVPSVPITDADKKIATIQPVESGVYTFEFSASDGIETCEPLQVTVTATPNGRPTAQASTDKQVYCTTDLVTLDGTASFDPNGHALSYIWTITDDGGTGHITSDLDLSDPTQPTLVPIDEGTLTVQLVVDDGFEDGESTPDEVQVVIDNALCSPSDGDTDGDKEEESAPVCEDNDNDCCCRNMAPFDTDDTDPDSPPGGCCAADGDETRGGGGGGCTQSPESMGWLLLLGLLALAVYRKRRQT